jgi:hypothetical protein
MNANLFNLPRSVGLLAGAMLLVTSVRAAEADAFPTFDNNYIKVSAQGATPQGSKAAYQARTQSAKSGAAGIEEFSYGYDLNKGTNLQIDGKALAGSEDYLGQFKITKNEVGTLEAGYKRFRTYYDGAGGFFPLNNAWLPIYPRELYVDRGKFFANATIALPKAPVFTFKYTNETRTGRKDSTIWGDSDLTGIPIWSQGALNPVSANRKILPAYNNLNERQENWEASVKHTVGNTTGVFTIASNRIKNFDYRSVDRYTGELKPFPAIPSTPASLIPNNLGNNPNKGLDQQSFKESGYTAGGRIETVINDRVTVFGAVNYHHATQDIAASRMITASYATATGVQSFIGAYNFPGGRPPYSYTSAGSMKLDILTGSVGAQLKPINNLQVEVALKGEEYKDRGNNEVSYVSNAIVLATGVVTVVPVESPNSFKNKEKPWTPSLDVRYTGIPKVALYGSIEYRNVKQDERTAYTSLNVNTTTGALTPGPSGSTDNIREKHTDAKLGANWTPTTFLTARAEVFTKDHENRFEGYDASAGSFYILDYDIYGAKVTTIFRPSPVLAFTTRGIVQRGKAAIAEDGIAKGDSNDSRRYQIEETVDWNPNKSFYVQVNGNLVFDTISTSYPRVTGTARDVLHNADNNYWNGNAIAGFVVDKDTDAQLQFAYYKADNYNAALATSTQPYGAGGRDYSVTAGLKHKFDAKTVACAKVGYIESRNDTAGGNSNFRGPVGYITVEHAF